VIEADPQIRVETPLREVRLMNSPYAQQGSSLSKQLGSARHLFVFDRVEIRTILLTRKEVIINIRPNSDDSDHIAN
jgi:hypothetical protein